jgi:dephospho-CoA kinase
MESSTAPRVVLAIGGRTSSGKTSVASLLSDRFGWQRMAFGDYVRSAAVNRGIPDDRRSLQDLGESMIEALGLKAFCLGALESSRLDANSAPCLIEGVRHLSVLECLREIFEPIPVLYVHLDVADGQRNQRLAASGISEEEGADWEVHSTERDVRLELPAAADLTIDANSRTAEEAANAVEAWLSQQS